ncbi:ATP-binding cassette domain-containing protein [Embleya scabrispora]|uniref:ATP-binding cassette domain-containing protein n=1 Tax=Embleya scabrispora TaxID=159449 RepID=UPI00036F024D|nr:ATP-binding cassette domain-containing protein [Embleya scabrispora]MYS81072.1 ATP-binding cassette domain-containing protein [Streptomyces sp. SID5474]
MRVLEVADIRRRFGGVEALRGVSLGIDEGEVVGLMGDNGAGKSTLMKVLCGSVRPDSGTMTLDGKPLSLRSPRDAAAHGIAVVYQDLALVDQRDVATNVFLGREPRRGLVVDRRLMRREARTVLDELSIRIPSVRLPVGGLSGGQRQCIAIARAVHQGGRIVLLDEPTAALGPEQQANVLKLIKTLKERGTAVIVVSHNVDHVLAVADRVVVMRAGLVQGVRDVHSTSAADVVGLILGSVAADAISHGHGGPATAVASGLEVETRGAR